jgi:hypothetical protein
LVIWIAWWLLAVNRSRAWPAIKSGGWAPVVLLMLVAALAWSRLQPVATDSPIPNFWWQLGYITGLVGVALFCGWLQGILGWTVAEIDLEPPAPGHGDAHGHAAHH